MITRLTMNIDMNCQRLYLFIAFIGMNTVNVDTIPASSWGAREHRQIIDNFLDITSARSKLDCVRICSGFSQCMTCAFETNQPEIVETEGRVEEKPPGICYLMPSVSSVSQGLSSPVTVLSRENRDTLCQESKSLPIANGKVTSWRRTLTSVEGKVICDADYIYVGNNPVVKCFLSNQWHPPDGRCLQRLWTFITAQTYVDVPIPKLVNNGWSVCLNVTPTQHTRVAVNLVTNKYKALLHLDFRFNYLNFLNTIVMDSNYSGFWGWRTELERPTPFVASPLTPFTVVVTVLSDKEVQITMKGDKGSWTKPSRSLPTWAEEIKRVTVSGDFSITLLDLLCNKLDAKWTTQP